MFRLVLRDFFSRQKQPRSNKEFKMTPTIQPSLYPEGTLVIKTWGPGAARTTHLGIQRHLGALTGAHRPPSRCGGRRTRTVGTWWACRSSTARQDRLQSLCVFFRIEELERETTRATIHWLPPTLKIKYEGLKKILQKAVGGGTFENVPHRIDQAAVYVPRQNEKDIPHYVELKYEDETTFLLVTVPGRRTQCRHCGNTDHCSNRCTGATPPPPPPT